MSFKTEVESSYFFHRFVRISRRHRGQPERMSKRRARVGGLGVGLLSFVTLIAFTGQSAQAATSIDLGAATSYAVIAGSAITNTGSSVLTGDVGLSPGSSIGGFPPGHITGNSDAADAQSLLAQGAATSAFGIAQSAPSTSSLALGVLAGTLSPGVYTASSDMSLTGTLTLDGGGNLNSVFIFQAGTSLTTASGSSVVLQNGAQACHVFWQVGSTATLGTTTAFVGTILALTSAVLDTGATVDGRVFAQTAAVTLDDNTISVPTCATPPTTTTTARRYPIVIPTTTVPAPTTTTTVAPTTTTTVAPTTTTTLPAPTPAVLVTKKKVPPARPAKSLATTATVIPVGAPATGEGGTAGSGSSTLGLIALAALSVGLGAATVAVRFGRLSGRGPAKKRY